MAMPKKSNKRRNDGRIAVQIYLGRDPETNKRKYKTVYGQTQKEAKAEADIIRLALKKGIDVSPELVTFSDWADRWLSIKKPSVTAARTVTYECNIKHLKAAFGSADITKLRPADLQNAIINLSLHNPNTGKPAAFKTLSGIKSTAMQVFQLAKISLNIWAGIGKSLIIPARTASPMAGAISMTLPLEKTSHGLCLRNTPISLFPRLCLCLSRKYSGRL
jgi:hypothetical protein